VLAYAQAKLGADVAIATDNVWVDGPSVALAAGTWLLTGTLQLYSAGNAATIQVKLWDGTTVGASGECLVIGGGSAPFWYGHITLTAIVTLSPGATWKISATSQAHTGNLIKAAMHVNGAGNNASVLTALQLA
jgi:hypothetical protein